MHVVRITCILTLLLAAIAATAQDKDAEKPADKPKYDVKKLPVGSVWKGTLKRMVGEKLVSTSDLIIRITHREGTTFKGIWSTSDGGVRLVIEGSIGASDRINFEVVKRLTESDKREIVVANAKNSAQLTADNELIGESSIPETKRHSTWRVKLAKD